MDPLYTVELFGGLRVVAHFDTFGESSGRTVTRFRTHQTGSLLAYLACNAGRVLSREVLIDMLWPDACAKSGRSRLSMALSSLRSQLEPPGIAAGSVVETGQHRIGLSRLVTTDTMQFEALMDAAERPTCDAGKRKEMFEKAVRLFSRELAPGHYDSWILAEQERLADRARKALLFLARAAERAGDIDVAISHARRAASECDGLCDEAEAMLDRFSAGGKSLPLAAESRGSHSATRSNLGGKVEEPRSRATLPTKILSLAAEPTTLDEELPETTPVTAPTIPVVGAPVPALPVPLTRFFGRRNELRSLNAAVADPQIRLITLSGPGGAGKSRLLREAALRWRAPRMADDLERTSDTFYLQANPEVVALDLASELDAFRIPIRVAAALDLNAADVNPFESMLDENSLAQFVTAFSTKRNPLLILDNIEQLLPRGGDWLEALLQRVPHLTCVVTSRVRLRVPGEHEIPIAPLAAPPVRRARHAGTQSRPDSLTEYLSDAAMSPSPDVLLRDWPSVALFVDRAQAARPGFALTRNNADDVLALVAHLEGLPLSIELAAARAQVMTPAHMLRQLHDDRFDLLTSRGSGATGRRKRAGRHTSLRETVAWSVSLLPEDIQTFYAQMSVFRGGWGDEAAEAVSDNPMALDALAVLCDASLVSADATIVEDDELIRFDMLESLRDFASSLLNPRQDEENLPENAEIHPEYVAAATRHSEFFAETVAQCAPHFQSANAKPILQALSRDNENIKAAINWATSRGTPESAQLALTMGGSLGPYWGWTGRVHEGRDLLKGMLARPARKPLAALPPAVSALKLGEAVSSLGILAMQQRDYMDANRRFRSALFLERRDAAASLALAPGDPVRTQYLRRHASVLNNVAIAKRQLKDHGGAARAFMDSLELWRELGEGRFVGTVLSNLGNIAGTMGNNTLATTYFREAISIHRSANNLHGEATALNNLADISYRCGLIAEADSNYRQSLRIYHLQNDVCNSAKTLFQLGLIGVQQRTTLERSIRMLQIAWLALLEDGVALNVADKAEAFRLLGDDWMRPTEDFEDLRSALHSAITALLGENRFASAFGATRAESALDPVRV